MVTRREVFWARNSERVTQAINGITFLNVPTALDTDGDYVFDLTLRDALDELAETVPDSYRLACIFDCAHLPIWDLREARMEAEHHSMPDSEHLYGQDEVEKRLMEFAGLPMTNKAVAMDETNKSRFMHMKMKCYCGKTTEMIFRDMPVKMEGTVIVVKNVPVHLCDHCGQILSGSISMKMAIQARAAIEEGVTEIEF